MNHFSRKDFPVLSRKINGKPVIYLDSTASALKPQSVIDAENEYYRNFSVNIFRGVYKLSEEATERFERTRETVAAFIHVVPEEVIFVRNATEAMNLVATSWGRANIGDGDEIVSTVMEHHANIVPWQEVAKEKHATLKFIDITGDGLLDIDSLEKLVGKKTKIVCITHASNVLGTINPVRQIVDMVKRINPGTLVLVDAAQSVPHMTVDVKSLGCDFLAFSGHKMLGPTGTGVLWGKKEILSAMPPYQMGGEMIKEVYLDHTVYNDIPYKFEAGTPHIAGVIGLEKAVTYLQDIGMDAVREHEQMLVRYALKLLSDIRGLTMYGPTDAAVKGGVIAFTVKGVHPHDVAQVLDRSNICIRSGHHCAMPLHTRLGIGASCRASFYIYTTKSDIDALVTGIEESKKVFGIKN
jgi:cysteine desulfurase / selenocysteine lyase